MTLLTSSPALVVPGRQTRIVFTLTGSTANHLIVYCTQAPKDSALDVEIKKSTASAQRVGVYNGIAGPDAPWVTEFDLGGAYTFVCQEVQIGTTFTGGYQDDPRGAPKEVYVGAPTTLVLYVGQRAAMDLGTGRDSGELVYWIWNDRIRHTTLQEHGEATPVVTGGTSQRARAGAATVSASVRSVLTDEMLVADAFGDVPSYLTALINRWNAHLIQAPLFGYFTHADQDSVNVVPLELGAATLVGLPAVVERFLRAERQHFLNDEGTGPGSANGSVGPPVHANPFHNPLGEVASDQLNLPITEGLSDVGSAYRAIADLHFSLDEHRQSTAVHLTADLVEMPPLPPMLEVARRFLDYLSTIDPPPAPGDTIGATVLRSYGVRI